MYLLGAIPLLALLLTASAFGQATARDYYKELYDAGGLDRMVARYVCFQDDSKAENFFIFAESEGERPTFCPHGIGRR